MKQRDCGVYGRIEADVFLLFFPYKENIIEWNQKYIHDHLLTYRDDFQLVGNSGVYVVQDRVLTVEAIFNRATVAAKNSPNKQGGLVNIFDETMEMKLIQEQNILKEMKKAIKEEQFQVYLQPKYKIVSGEAFGAEALVRWMHPEKGLISPGTFIPVFETNGFITILDRYMWEHVCQLIRKWLDEGRSPAPISVNMSRVSMYSPQTVPFLVGIIEKYQIPPELLNLELTESAYMDDPEEMKKRLKELRQHGFEIMMDDFGSGYSSLNTLRDIPVDYLKVDRMFLASVDCDKKCRLVLASVVHMATKMGIPVITEGVETEAQKEFLTSIGCDYVQGFLYAKPMPALEYEEKYVKKKAYYKSQEKDSKISNTAINMEAEAQTFYNLLPNPIAFVEYVGETFSYLSANNGFLRTFGLHVDIMDKEELISKYLTETDYEVLRATYQRVAETKQAAWCTIKWKHSHDLKKTYLVQVQYVDKSAYSTSMVSSFVDLTNYKIEDK